MGATRCTGRTRDPRRVGFDSPRLHHPVAAPHDGKLAELAECSGLRNRRRSRPLTWNAARGFESHTSRQSYRRAYHRLRRLVNRLSADACAVGARAACPRPDAGSARTASDLRGPARGGTRRTARRRSARGAVAARRHTDGPCPADAPDGSGSARPPHGAGSGRSSAGLGGRVRVRTARTAPRHGSVPEPADVACAVHRRRTRDRSTRGRRAPAGRRTVCSGRWVAAVRGLSGPAGRTPARSRSHAARRAALPEPGHRHTRAP